MPSYVVCCSEFLQQFPGRAGHFNRLQAVLLITFLGGPHGDLHINSQNPWPILMGNASFDNSCQGQLGRGSLVLLPEKYTVCNIKITTTDSSVTCQRVQHLYTGVLMVSCISTHWLSYLMRHTDTVSTSGVRPHLV